MSVMASQITSLTIVYSSVYSGTGQRKHQSSSSLAYVRGIHRWPMNCPHKGPVMPKMFPFDDVIMRIHDWIDLVWSYVLKSECNGQIYQACNSAFLEIANAGIFLNKILRRWFNSIHYNLQVIYWITFRCLFPKILSAVHEHAVARL